LVAAGEIESEVGKHHFTARSSVIVVERLSADREPYTIDSPHKVRDRRIRVRDAGETIAVGSWKCVHRRRNGQAKPDQQHNRWRKSARATEVPRASVGR
jgi:hypothetical protein